MEMPLAQILQWPYILTKEPLKVHALLTALRAGSGEAVELQPGLLIPGSEAAALWVCAWILHRGKISFDALQLIVHVFRTELNDICCQYMEMLDAGDTYKLPTYVLAVADGRLVTLGNRDKILDISCCRIVNQLPRTFEGLSYNLAIPVQTEWAALQARKARANDTSSTHEGNTTESGDASYDSAGDCNGPSGSGVSGVGS